MRKAHLHLFKEKRTWVTWYNRHTSVSKKRGIQWKNASEQLHLVMKQAEALPETVLTNDHQTDG